MKRFLTSRKALAGASVLVLAGAVGIGQIAFDPAVAQNGDAPTRSVEAPRFEVDPLWPKPMPNNWVLGQTIGVAVDADDHIWIVHRGWDPAALDNTELAVPLTGGRAGQLVGECCNPSPPIMEFDQEGNLLHAWGGPSETGEYEWPTSNHGLAIDDEGFIYIGGNGAGDAHILKFTQEGEFVAQFGRADARRVDQPAPAGGGEAPAPTYQPDSTDMESFGRVAKIDMNPQNPDEAFVSDGYLNHRVAVINIETGEILRYWGAYGNEPDDADTPLYDPTAPIAQQFRNPVHCANASNDGLVYVCDRPNNRIQVFQTDGTFVGETFVATETLADGSVWDIDFSADPEQAFLYVADGVNEHVRVFNRSTMEELYNFGYGGRQPGMFLGVHSIAVDSQGNIYTTETYTGKRLQKFVFMGVDSTPIADGQVPWGGAM